MGNIIINLFILKHLIQTDRTFINRAVIKKNPEKEIKKTEINQKNKKVQWNN